MFRVFTCTTFTGHYPVGTSAVIVARDENHARDLLNYQLEQEHLDQLDLTDEILELETDIEGAIILQNGNY